MPSGSWWKSENLHQPRRTRQETPAGNAAHFTPTALVKLSVEIIEPFHGRLFEPACGSGGVPKTDNGNSVWIQLF